ncbi:MAG: hypothetical protein ACQESE_04440 [Nanobdellota archaeon]
MTSTALLQRAFFGKDNCLKVTLHKKLECYFEFGTPKAEKEKGWKWKPVKFNDVELGEILLVLEGKKQSVSFFHKYKDETTQIWVSRKDKFVTIKVKELSKGLNEGEQTVLRELIRHIIVRINLTF